MDTAVKHETNDNSHQKKSQEPLDKNNAVSKEKNALLAKLAFWKISLKLNKPLLPLKIALFFWFGAGANISTFYLVNLKQKGLSIAQISLLNIITPIIQCFGPPISGLIADKIGRAKPILFAHFAIVLLFANALLFIPNVNTFIDIKVNCTRSKSNNSFLRIGKFINISRNCTNRCESSSFEDLCFSDEDMFCEVQDKTKKSFKFVVSFCKQWYVVENDFNLTKIKLQNAQQCNTDICNKIQFIQSDVDNDNSLFVFVMSLICTAGFFTTLSDIFRFLDITTMYMIKAHDSDFGRERVWSILGLLILSPISGYLVEITSPVDGLKNYAMSFYVFDVLTLISIAAVWKLDVQIKAPGENLFKKTIGLLRNIDVLVFAFALLTLGTTWSFQKHYTSLFLVEFNVSSMLLSLVPCINAIYGLPFLITSNWWVTKFGSTNLLVCAFVAYIFGCVAYSFLTNPWWSLLIELDGIFTYHLLWVAVVRHSHDIAPEGLTATVIASAGGIHYAAGKAMSGLIGGLVMSQYGARLAFIVMASICAVVGSLYSLFLFFRWRYRSFHNPDPDKKVTSHHKATELATIAQVDTVTSSL